jgi:hypothetical protein
MLKRPKEQAWSYEQPPEPFPRVPGSGLALGPTGSGKSSTIISMLLGPYRYPVFQRVYVFSPSVDIDSLWDEWKSYNRKVLGVDEEKEQTMWNHWDESALEMIMKRQAKITKHMKDHRAEFKGKLYGCCICVDDLADNPALHKAHGVLASIFTRGRHQGVSCWILSQKLTAVSLVARVNFRFILCWRLRNMKELLDGILHELSAIQPASVLRAMYDQCVSEPYGFWYINLMKQPDEMFYQGFDEMFVLQ